MEFNEVEYTEEETAFREEMHEKILDHMAEKDYRPARFKELKNFFDIDDEDEDKFLGLLNEMEDEVSIVKTKNNRYMLPPDNVLVGTYLSTRRGFGFVSVEGYTDDFFIPTKDSLNAFHDDRVLIQVTKRSYARDMKSEARVVRILNRGITTLIGVYQASDGYGFVIPNNKKIADDIFIPEKASKGAVSGSLVIVELQDYGTGKKSPTGVVTEVIGHVDDPTTDILSVIKSYNIPVEFPDAVEEQLLTIPEEVDPSQLEGRHDFRDLDTVTIDGEDAKDLDDAISLSYENGIYHLGVHIADVSEYVKENSALDKEALNRGTSNYLVDSVIPMLPHKLSNGICSLNHDVDRLTLSCVMDIDERGRVVSHEICEGVINVNERMNYTDVAAILEGRENAPVERYKPLIPMFRLMLELSEKIRENRAARGSIDFDVAETKIIVDEDSKPVEIKPYERNCATKIIEDFMLIANETVAEEYFWADLPFEYRVHEVPNEEKVDSLRAVIRNFGLYFKVSRDKMHPKEFQKLLKSIEGKPYEALVTRLTLRSMQQARYGTECLGHFGLACKYYCHFTSPIRRYPDLQIHRIIKENLHGKLDERRIKHYAKLLPKVAEDNSFKERRAETAERDVEKLKEIEYMSEHIGETFAGMVSGFTSQYIFIELENTIEGAVSVASLDDDFYVYNEEKMEMTGNSTGRRFRLGDKAVVKVVKCDKIDRVIDFEFAE
ncbi:MAG: ribonuclease R [Eubacterium sp.]|nr:ribonuclease R [Eubacterium sp.]